MTCAPVLLIRPAIAHEIFATLCNSPPPPVTDTQEARDALYDKAMAAIAGPPARRHGTRWLPVPRRLGFPPRIRANRTLPLAHIIPIAPCPGSNRHP